MFVPACVSVRHNRDSSLNTARHVVKICLGNTFCRFNAHHPDVSVRCWKRQRAMKDNEREEQKKHPSVHRWIKSRRDVLWTVLHKRKFPYKLKIQSYLFISESPPRTDVLMPRVEPPAVTRLPTRVRTSPQLSQDNGHLCTTLTSTSPATATITSRLCVCQRLSVCCVQTAEPHLAQWNICVVFSFHFLSPLLLDPFLCCLITSHVLVFQPFSGRSGCCRKRNEENRSVILVALAETLLWALMVFFLQPTRAL